MTRTLPWLKSSTTTVTAPAKNERPAKRQKLQHTASEDDNTTGVAGRPRKAKRRPDRTPSTSPPPAPPTPEFMRPGFDKDDIYMLVEDEFLSTAQLFTQHLHHAEYMRLKNLARSQNASASALRSIIHPVDDRTKPSAEKLQRKQAAAAAVADNQEKNALKGISGGAGFREEDDDEAHDPWMQNSHLAGLMTGSRQAQTLLSEVAPTKVNTRAAAGYSRPRDVSPERVKPILSGVNSSPGSAKHNGAIMEEEGSDLDAPTVTRSQANPLSEKSERPKPKSTLQPHLDPSSSTTRPPDLATRHSSTRRNVSSFFTGRGTTQSSSGSTETTSNKHPTTVAAPLAPSTTNLNLNTPTVHEPNALQPSFSDSYSRQSALSAEAAARIARRKAERTRREREEKGVVRVEEIPTFLV